MIKGIIFDLDGTTLDTVEDLRNALNKSIECLGFRELTRTELMNKVGHGFKDLVTKAMPNESEENIDVALSTFRNNYAKCYNVNTKPYEGIKELLNELASLNIKMAINSNKQDDFTKKLINENFPSIDFVSVIGQREGIAKKPDPYTANEIIELMKLNKDEVVYIGDSETDIKTGQNAGVKTIGCAWGFRGKEKLIECGADYIADKPKDILDIVKKN